MEIVILNEKEGASSKNEVPEQSKGKNEKIQSKEARMQNTVIVFETLFPNLDFTQRIQI